VHGEEGGRRVGAGWEDGGCGVTGGGRSNRVEWLLRLLSATDLAQDGVELKAELIPLEGELELRRVAVLIDQVLGDEAGHPVPRRVVRTSVGLKT